MQNQNFNEMLKHICLAMGKPMPVAGSDIYNFLRKSVEDKFIPDDAAKYIAEAIGNYDRMPQNLAKAIGQEFFAWIQENPRKQAESRGCRDCDPNNHGFFWAWDKDGKQLLCKCACNQDPRFANLQPWTKQRARHVGMELTDPNSNLDYWRQQVALWRQGKPYQKPCRETNNTHGVIGHKGQERAEHANLRSDDEARMW